MSKENWLDLQYEVIDVEELVLMLTSLPSFVDSREYEMVQLIDMGISKETELDHAMRISRQYRWFNKALLADQGLIFSFETVWRERAVDLILEGFNYRDVAAMLNYSHPMCVWEIVHSKGGKEKIREERNGFMSHEDI